MTDIKDGNHDIRTCKHNCKLNARIFQHSPYQCPYQNIEDIKNLIQHKKISVETLPPQVWSQDDEKAMKVVDFDFKSTLAKERESELALGLRTDDDIKELVNHLEKL